MQVILAGMGNKYYEQCCKEHGMTKLYSALNERRMIDKFQKDYPLMVDSGAHSWNKIGLNVVGGKASVSLPPLSEWIPKMIEYYTTWDNSAWTLVELDVYAEMKMPDIDLMATEIRGKLNKAEFLRVYHIQIDGGSLKVLKKWLDEGYTYIGLALDSMPVWDKVFALTRDTIRYHGFAATRQELLLKYPFYSVDSSTAIAGIRYGGSFVNGKYISKENLHKTRHVAAMQDTNERRIEAGVKAMYQMQEFVTKVWKRRGVVWE